MSRIDYLVAQLCPDGVEYKRLGEVAKIKNGRDYKGLPEGDIAVYGSGGIMEARVGVSAYDKPTVLLPRKGSISNVFYVDKPFWNIDTAFYTVIDESQLIPRYFYHVMLAAHVENYSTGSAARPSLTQSALNKIEIPVPPMEIQQEIVKVLDSFIRLEAELEARRAQYRYYRDQLLSFERESPMANSRRVLQAYLLWRDAVIEKCGLLRRRCSLDQNPGYRLHRYQHTKRLHHSSGS